MLLHEADIGITAHNKQIVQAFIETVWRQGNLNALPDFCTHDCINHAAPVGQNEGLAALRIYHEQFGAAFAAFSDSIICVEQQVAEGARVVTQIRTSARHTDTFLGIPGTGKAVTLSTIRIDRLENDKIAEHWSVADMAGLMLSLQT